MKKIDWFLSQNYTNSTAEIIILVLVMIMGGYILGARVMYGILKDRIKEYEQEKFINKIGNP